MELNIKPNKKFHAYRSVFIIETKDNPMYGSGENTLKVLSNTKSYLGINFEVIVKDTLKLLEINVRPELIGYALKDADLINSYLKRIGNIKYFYFQGKQKNQWIDMIRKTDDDF